MNGLIGRLLRQSDVGNTWGYMVQTASQAAIVVTVVNFFMLAGTFFVTAVSPFLTERGVDMPFWLFLVILIAPLAVVGVLLFKFAVPSFFSAFNDQFYRHNNLLRQDIEQLKSANEEIKKLLGELLKQNEDSNCHRDAPRDNQDVPDNQRA